MFHDKYLFRKKLSSHYIPVLMVVFYICLSNAKLCQLTDHVNEVCHKNFNISEHIHLNDSNDWKLQFIVHEHTLFDCVQQCVQYRSCNMIYFQLNCCLLYLNRNITQNLLLIYNNIERFSCDTKLFKRQISESSINPTELVVSAKNRTIQLPIDQVVLSSFVLPKDLNYKYNWELISPLNTDDIGNIEGLNKEQVILSNLKAGNYTFKVTVKGEHNLTGYAIVSLTVLPPKTINKPPIAIIQPKNSTVQLPNKDTVLDGSLSSDDDKIVKYEWQAIKVPIGYKTLAFPNSSTLQLKNLIAGFYVLNLTVTDSQNASSFDTANITVLKEIDYPPTANAGPEKIIYLPQNEITLNGNMSTDDKGIVSWQWTRDDTSVAIDMNGTSTPYLHISKLKVGVYKFILQVVDTSGQMSKAETLVFVKPENNEAPISIAGKNIEIFLPINGSILLDGSKSTDDVAIVKWEWKQLSGPKQLILQASNSSIAKIDKIIPGIYNFSLTVWDSKNLSSVSFKTINVIQKTNMPPKAIAGGDQTIILPVDEVILNGSASYDDTEIVLFEWERLPLSLASGDIVGNSSKNAILKLINLDIGRYLFKLSVTDNQGAVSSDVASIIVKPPLSVNDQIEVVLNNDIHSFTVEQRNNILKQLEFILNQGETVKIVLNKIEKTRQRKVVLIFTVYDSNGNRMSGPEVVKKLKSKIYSDLNILFTQIISLETLICQNNCSSHGVCDQYTKRCMCEAFWMENFLRLYFGDKESNCDWSVLYVIIISFIMLISLTFFVWAFICLVSKYDPNLDLRSKHRRKSKRSKRNHYSLVDVEETFPLENTDTNKHDNLKSDSDSDSLFNLNQRNGYRNLKNKSNVKI